MIVEPKPWKFSEFPESTATIEGMKVLAADYSLYSCTYFSEVPYAKKDGYSLHLNIFQPRLLEDEQRTFPIILFVQGSGWKKQNLINELVQLSSFARRGYVIAIVEYRPSDVISFPGQVCDTKTAIRYMRDHAAEYNGNPDQMILWGDSSGGHTALMTTVTLNDPKYQDDSSDISDSLSLKACIDYYAPTDVSRMCEQPGIMDHISADSPEGLMIGGENVLLRPDLGANTIPMNYIHAEKEIPPILIFHGNKDRIVPFQQSVLLYEKLKAEKKEAIFYQIQNADHGGAPFWSTQVLDLVDEFIRIHL